FVEVLLEHLRLRTVAGDMPIADHVRASGSYSALRIVHARSDAERGAALEIEDAVQFPPSDRVPCQCALQSGSWKLPDERSDELVRDIVIRDPALIPNIEWIRRRIAIVRAFIDRLAPGVIRQDCQAVMEALVGTQLEAVVVRIADTEVV